MTYNEMIQDLQRKEVQQAIFLYIMRIEGKNFARINRKLFIIQSSCIRKQNAGKLRKFSAK